MGGYEAAAELSDQHDAFYTATAAMLGCSMDEVAFVSSASEGWWRAFTAIDVQPGQRILTGCSEFQANAFGLLQARERGVTVDVVPNDDNGLIDLEQLDGMLDETTRLVCLTHISMSNGAIQPAAAVGQRCHRAGIPMLLDACQAAGQLELDVTELGCDFLVYTGRKFMRGPRGTGVLYARRQTVDGLGPTGFVDGRSAEWLDDGSWQHQPGATRFEFGEQNFAGKAALGVATSYAIAIGLGNIAQRVQCLASSLRTQLEQIDGVVVHDEGIERCGIVTFTLDKRAATDVGAHLHSAGINVSTPGRRNAQWDIGRRNIDAVVRAGVHYFNTDDEISRLCHEVAAFRSSAGSTP